MESVQILFKITSYFLLYIYTSKLYVYIIQFCGTTWQLYWVYTQPLYA